MLLVSVIYQLYYFYYHYWKRSAMQSSERAIYIHQSRGQRTTIPTHRKEENKVEAVEDKNGVGLKPTKCICPLIKTQVLHH